MNEHPVLPGSLNLSFLEDLYSSYLQDPASVAPDWRMYFEQFAADGQSQPAPPQLGPSFAPRSLFNPPELNGRAPLRNGNGHAVSSAKTRDLDVAARQDRVDQLIRNYRVRGHRIARIDPLGQPPAGLPELDPKSFGFTEADLDKSFSTIAIDGANVRTLRRIIERMRNTYCRFIGVQFMHIDDISVREWLTERMEGTENRLELSRSEQLRILTRLTDAVIFEEFIIKKFSVSGAKSFSLEGAESLIPLLDLAIEKAGAQGIEEIVLGMAHRGRLNVLANILNKSAQQIFREFEDKDPHLHEGRGDVKYHLGHSSDWPTASGQNVHLSLCFNPSHLEFVNPVALGRCRAKQDRDGDKDRSQVMTLLIHGDAAFAGEGVLQETFNMSQLGAYATGGTLHVVVNNQIGFTTSPHEGRSSTYATDVAKMLQIPIFHVNGEHPEAVAQVVRLAMDFRQTFQRDVVIDMYCYRLRGHNEQDEPAFTHPLLYAAIGQHDSVRDSYLDHLLTLGGVTVDEADWIAERSREHLEHELSIARGEDYQRGTENAAPYWRNFHGGKDSTAPEVATAVPAKQLTHLLKKLTDLPADFHPHPKIARLLKTRADMATGSVPLDWAAGEALAFATLATEGVRIRMSGQDSCRGTFSHRHAVLHDIQDGHRYTPLQHVAPNQVQVEIFNSPLSEIGVLGFEYGYSLDRPDGLVIWEAQFGDFVNAAQVILDQFIVSAEDKWRRLSGLVLLLPHGFEGQGPEHSSARLERFLSQAAEDNIQVVNLTTPAQFFHCLRRQVHRPLRKPLIVMTPKSLLRNPQAISTLQDLSEGSFQRILPDAGGERRKKVKRVLLCSGKIYYELAAYREEQKRPEVAILRVEQLYPLSPETLAAALAPYAAGTPVYWVQEEPENMGAWHYFLVRHGERMLGKYPFQGVTRPASASPATGSSSSHKLEQKKLLEQAFADL